MKRLWIPALALIVCVSGFAVAADALVMSDAERIETFLDGASAPSPTQRLDTILEYANPADREVRVESSGEVQLFGAGQGQDRPAAVAQDIAKNQWCQSKHRETHPRNKERKSFRTANISYGDGRSKFRDLTMGRALMWSFGLIVLLVLMAMVIARLRKRLSPGQDAPAAGFTLGELRDLHRKGKMTDTEFEAAKGLVLRGLKQERGK